MPTSTIENWARELQKWLPFMNIGVVALTDSESIEVVVKSVIKGHLVEHSRPDYRDADILYSDTN